eukprot:714572-Prymnesium_polylepis.1
MFAVLFCLFFTWFTTWLYLPAFMGIEVYGGSPNPALADNSTLKHDYNEGARASSFGMLGASCEGLLSARAVALSAAPSFAMAEPPLSAEALSHWQGGALVLAEEARSQAPE